jgi:hypothetical protein
MRLSTLLVLVAVLGLATALVQAYPNLNATSGILAVPTAVVVPAGDSQWAADVLFLDDTSLNGRVVYGLSDRLEIGAGIVTGEDTVFGANIKLRMPTTLGAFNWALGATFSDADAGGSGFQLYGTGTRTFGLGGNDLITTLGLSYTDVDSATALRPFIGGQLQIMTGTELDAEFVLDSGDFDESVESFLLRHRFNDFIAGEAGFTNAFGFAGTSSHDLFLGVTFTGRAAR